MWKWLKGQRGPMGSSPKQPGLVRSSHKVYYQEHNCCDIVIVVTIWLQKMGHSSENTQFVTQRPHIFNVLIKNDTFVKKQEILQIFIKCCESFWKTTEAFEILSPMQRLSFLCKISFSSKDLFFFFCSIGINGCPSLWKLKQAFPPTS